MYLSLIFNVSLILALTTLHSLILHASFAGKKSGKILKGLTFGLTALAAMSVAYRYGSGIIYDGRSIIISLSGLYGGPMPAVIASTISLAYRAYLGGNGVWAGLATIFFCGLTGIISRKYFDSKINNLKIMQLFVFGFLVHLIMLACQLLIKPWPLGLTVIRKVWLPVLLIFPAATVLTGLLLQRENKRLQAETKLRESEEKYRTLFDNAGQLIIVVKDGLIRLVNKKALEYGYREDEIIGKPFIDFIHPEDRKMVWERHLRRLKEEVFEPTYEFRFISGDGTVRWVEITAVKIDWDGKPATLNYVSDITDKVIAKKEKEELFRIIEESENEIYIFDADNLKFTYVNRAALKNTGYTLEELRNLTPLALKTEFDRIKFNELLRPLREGRQKKLLFETSHLRKDGSSYPVQVHLQMMDFAHRNSFVAVVIDITEKQKAARNLEKTLEGIIRAVARTVEVRDPYTAGHQERVAELAEAIARELKMEESQIQAIRFASLIHDLGKIAVPPEILNKPGKLSVIEMELIKTHSRVGYEILRDIEFPWPVADIVLLHHEKIDGSGYPLGLKGDQILLEARIICVADVVEAIASHRPYRPALGMEKALEEIKNNSGKLYDPEVVACCVDLIEKKGFRFTTVKNSVL